MNHTHYNLRITDLEGRRTISSRVVYGDPKAALTRVLSVYERFDFEVMRRSPVRAIVRSGDIEREVRIVTAVAA